MTKRLSDSEYNNSKQLLLGNQAVARGAWEAGVNVVCSYPGTPSTEITETIAKYEGVNTQWAPNEKVAMEVAYGASLAGARAMSCMKHVGVNVAADPIFTAAYSGVNGGLVLCCSDDPAMHSSQNEQDSRYYARAAHIPMLEPSDSQECYEYTKLAFDMSEQLDTPVFVRLTTRISHARSVVNTNQRASVELKSYEKNPAKYVMMPAMARKRHPIVEKREIELAKQANSLEINKTIIKDTLIGYITSGVCYQYVCEAFPDASVLKLGLVYPLPMEKIIEFSKKVDRLIVIEELEGLIEKDIKAQGIKCEGKNLTGLQGELSVEKLKQIILGENINSIVDNQIPMRPPVLCAGCPHRGVFYVINKLKLNVMGDIGCYTLAALPPLSAMDACLCMGASIGMASGMYRAKGEEISKKTVAVIGDSTFLHSGVTSLIDAVYNKESITVIILDNRITGMTGHQQNHASGKDINDNPAPAIDFEQLCSACGVKSISVVDPFDLKVVENTIKSETQKNEVSVIIAKRPCALLNKEPKTPFIIDGCKNCGACMKLSCPAIERKEDRVEINPTLCIGCGMCQQVCAFKAIRKGC